MKYETKISIFKKIVKQMVQEDLSFSKAVTAVSVKTGLSRPVAHRQFREFLYGTGPNGRKMVVKSSRKSSATKRSTTKVSGRSSRSKKPRA